MTQNSKNNSPSLKIDDDFFKTLAVPSDAADLQHYIDDRINCQIALALKRSLKKIVARLEELVEGQVRLAMREQGVGDFDRKIERFRREFD